jgi:putative transposase
MMYPLVRELAAEDAPMRVPVAVTCRVLKIARQPYYRWLARPVTDAELEEAYRANALFDAHRDDPEFGYRFLVDEARDAGYSACDRTMWRVCSDNGWWSAFGKKRGKNGKKPGPPVHDDLVERNFAAEHPNQLWLADITEHRTGEGKLYLCAIKDVFSNRIVGYSMDSRMKSRLAVDALNSAAARRADVAGCILHTDRGSQGGFKRSSQHPDDGGVDGQASWVDAGADWAVADAIARRTVASTGDRAGVLAGDRQGVAA